MPIYKRGVRGGKVKVAEYDTTLMLTLNDVLPTDRNILKKYLIRTKNAPSGKLRDFYNTKDNSALVRKMFTVLLKEVLFYVANGLCEFIVPNKGASKPKIYVGFLSDKEVKFKRKTNRLQQFNLFQTDYKIPYLQYKLSPTTLRKDLKIYLNKNLFNELINTANSGKKFSRVPKDIDYFLPYIYEEFSYIQPTKIKSLMTECFRLFHKALRQGEEIRIIDGDGEIRFFRNLGQQHDLIMSRVKKRRLTIERKKREEEYGSIS